MGGLGGGEAAVVQDLHKQRGVALVPWGLVPSTNLLEHDMFLRVKAWL